MKQFQRLPLLTVSNCRDLGGYPVSNNKVTKWNKFLRSSNLNNISKKDLLFLKEYGLKNILDLRKSSEIDAISDSIELLKKHFNYINISLASNINDVKIFTKRIEDINMDDLVDSYILLLENYKIIKEIFTFIANTEGLILFNCHEGKDRTGIIALILLSILGVNINDIISNYEVSSANLGYICDVDFYDEIRILRITYPDTIFRTYNYIVNKYGNFYNYLLSTGVSKENIDKIIQRSLEDI